MHGQERRAHGTGSHDRLREGADPSPERTNGHAETWSAATGSSSIETDSQPSRAWAQRGAKGQPAGKLAHVGRLTGDRPQLAAGRAAVDAGHGREQRLRVRVLGSREEVADGATSTMRPAYITATRSHVWAITPMSWETSMMDMPVSSRISRRRTRIWSWIVTSRAVVGSSASSSRGRPRNRDGDHHPLAHPAAELVRVGPQAPLGRRDADARRAARPPACGRRRAPCRRARVSTSIDLVADGEDRVERAHRVLEDHRDLTAADPAQLALAQLRARSRPSSRIPPPSTAPGSGTSPTTARQVTLFPDPDSPTSPRISPAPTLEADTSVRPRATPDSVGNPTVEPPRWPSSGASLISR